MENACTEVHGSRVFPDVLTLSQRPAKALGMLREAQGRLVRALGIEREEYFPGRRILPRIKWGEKNNASLGAFAAPQGIPCKPLRTWAMILQENKIRK
jgi:hypothetical protein